MSASEDSPRPVVPDAGRRRTRSRDSALLAAGSAVNGLLAYVFFALASRSLGADAAAPVSVLWSYWAVAGAVLTFPVQHWIIRGLTGDAHEAGVARAMPRLCAVVAGVAAVAGMVAFVGRDQLFGLDGVAFPALVAGVTAGSFLMGLVRGVLSGRGRYAATAASLVAENVLRVVVAAVTAWAGGGAVAFGVALVVGPLSGLVWAPVLRLRRARAGAGSGRGSLTLLTGVAGGSLVAQIVLSGPPVVLAVMNGAPGEVTSLFLALAVWRAPYLVALGVTPQLTTVLTRFAVGHRPRRLVRVSRLTLLGVVVSGGVAAVLGATLLGPFLRLVFGADVALEPAASAGLGVGSAFALGNLVLLLVLLALGRSRATMAAWLVAVALAGGWLLASGLPPVPTVVVAFLVAEAVTFVVLAAAVEWEAARLDVRGRAGASGPGASWTG